MNKRNTCISIMLVLFVFAILVSLKIEATVQKTIHQHKVSLQEPDQGTGLDEKGTLATHLPILILKTQGAVIPGKSRSDLEKLYCEYALIDHKDQINISTDFPTQSGKLALSIRGNSSRNFFKKQYAMKLVDHRGKAVNEELLGMPAESNWVLNGSYIDYSQLRNYISYNISGEIMKDTPKCRLCEVMLTDSNGHTTYEGLYTLIEKPKVSKNRLNLTPYDPKYKESSFLLHMNTPVDGVELFHLKPDNLNVYSCELLYPSQNQMSALTHDYINKELVRIEKVLFDADFTKDWSKVEEYVNVDSFVDYYIINEFFQNYDAGKRSTYLYKDVGGKFTIGPVWDFDGAFNNFSGLNFPTNILEIKSTYYYYYLTQSPLFLKKLQIRYEELRQTFLSETYLLNYVEESYAYAKSAIMRNEERWYSNKKGCVEKDIEKLKSFVKERGAWMDEHFIEQSGLID